MKTFILTVMDGRKYVITDEQKKSISSVMEHGVVKAITIGEDLIPLHQITGISNMDTYNQQMKTPLAIKKLRMCRRCGTIMPLNSICPCVDMPEKFPDMLEQARTYNPMLSARLDLIASKKQVLLPESISLDKSSN